MNRFYVGCEIGEASCCISCHEDHDDYDFDLIRVELKDGTLAEVCCAVAGEIEGSGD